jgi:hypothetical protein
MKGKVNPTAPDALSAPSAGRYIVVSARVPIPVDPWEAATVMHNMRPAISEVQKIFADASGDPEFVLSQEVVPVRPEGVRRGRRPKAAAPDPVAGAGVEAGEEDRVAAE